MLTCNQKESDFYEQKIPHAIELQSQNIGVKLVYMP